MEPKPICKSIVDTAAVVPFTRFVEETKMEALGGEQKGQVTAKWKEMTLTALPTTQDGAASARGERSMMKALQFVYDCTTKFAVNIVKNLDLRFSAQLLELCDAFAIINPHAIGLQRLKEDRPQPRTADEIAIESKYGCAELDVLIQQYGVDHYGIEKQIFEVGDRVSSEWVPNGKKRLKTFEGTIQSINKETMDFAVLYDDETDSVVGVNDHKQFFTLRDTRTSPARPFTMLSTADFKRKINPDKAREEWPLIRDKMWELSKGLSQPLSKREFVDKFYSLGLQDEFPTFDFFIQSEGIIGMSSCAPERVFSGLTTVKTDKRDGIQIDAVDTHVGMYMSGPKKDRRLSFQGYRRPGAH